MAVNVQKRRRSPVRSRAIKSTDPQQPRRIRAALGVSLFILLFGLMWLIDGNWTAENSIRVFGTDYLGGWVVHLLITAIQVLPALVVPWLPERFSKLALLIWIIALPCGIFNVHSSAVGIMPFLLRFGLETSVLNLLATVLGEVTAFLPEKAIGMLLVLLHTIYRG